MARPLLTLVPLMLSTAHATPPVPPDRVTGNVSTEHHQRRVAPPTDACRVTGNLLATKSPQRTCQIRVAGASAIAATPWLDASCVGLGVYDGEGDARVCVLPPVDPSVTEPLHVPASAAAPVAAEEV